MAHIITDIYTKILNGDRVTDAEARAAFTHFDNLQLMLYQSGPVFTLSAREARRVRDLLEDILKSRKLSI